MLEWLKEILGVNYSEETDKRVSQEIGKNFVSRADFNTKAEALKTAENNLKDRDKQLETLKTSSGDAETLKKQIADLQKANADAKKKYDEQLAQLRLDTAVENALTAAGAKNNVAAKALLTDFLKDAKVGDDGNVKGLAEQIGTLAKAEATSFLFSSPEKGATINGMKPGTVTGNSAQPQDMTLDALRKMSPAERYDYSVKHPEKYKELYGGN